VLPDDVKRCAAPVLAHRVILKPESRLRKITAEHVVNEVVGELAVPTLDVPPTAPGAGAAGATA
jgi:MoxR-like ATPase